jgi:hypothetical protein
MIEAWMASDYNVKFRAVHINTLWRKSKHYDIENALRGKRGATELFAGRGEINYEQHGSPQYVIAWENGSAVGIAVKSDGNGGLLERSVSVDFDDDVGIPAEVLDRLFCSMSPKSSYWWVNHKQTYKAELEGGYIWSPKTKSNGHQHQSYTNLTLVNPGDVVISYAGAEIRAIGVVTASCSERPKPVAFGRAGENWSDSGWLVPVEWSVLESPISPKDHLAEFIRSLPNRHSPLQPNGNGNQSCYLASVSADMGELVLKLASASNLAAVERVQELEDQLEADAIEQGIKGDESISQTDREQLVRSRIGQGKFRRVVQEIERACRLTGVADERFLIASHIKPWKDCNHAERLDSHNGLMLTPHVDKLFDRGWISFSDDGQVLISEQAKSVAEVWGLVGAPNVGAFSPKQQAFLKYHREKVFKGA